LTDANPDEKNSHHSETLPRLQSSCAKDPPWSPSAARGAAYFINLKEWEAEDGAWMYLIGFAPDKDVDPNPTSI
jgi:hypothetical protein